MTSPLDPGMRVRTLDVEFGGDEGLEAHWDKPRIIALVRTIIANELPDGPYAITLHLVDDAEIQTLNRVHRQLDAATDVLSFPLRDPHEAPFVLPPGQPIHLGDVVVSYPRAVQQAQEFGHSLERELAYLTAHGVLHILGYDHEESGQQSEMRRREEAALISLGLSR